MNESCNIRSLPRTAAEWFAARHGPREAELEPRFADWLREDPKNADEYALCELTWALAGDAASRPEPAKARPHPHRPWAIAAAAALVAACGLLGIYLLTPARPVQWHTAPGEQLSVTLKDGSRITLNTRTTLEVRMSRSERDVTMLAGEAFFEVAKDSTRPFIVGTPLGTARAVGTRFNVYLQDRRVEVETAEGNVLVKAAEAPAGPVLATAGMRATLEAGVERPRLDRADLTRIENWRARRLEFDRVPLAIVLQEFSRYTQVPIRPASSDIGRMYISAVLKAGDMEALRATLNGAFGLTLVPGRGAWLVTAPRS